MVTLFDTHPKSDPKYLYGREKELNDLVGHVKSGDWVVLLGPRRVGKTSLARCTATKLRIRTLVIDARIESDFARGLTNGLSSPQTVNIQGSAAIPHVPVSVSAGYTKTLLAQPLEQLLSNVKKELLVIVDEAQWLKNPRGVASSVHRHGVRAPMLFLSVGKHAVEQHQRRICNRLFLQLKDCLHKRCSLRSNGG